MQIQGVRAGPATLRLHQAPWGRWTLGPWTSWGLALKGVPTAQPALKQVLSRCPQHMPEKCSAHRGGQFPLPSLKNRYYFFFFSWEAEREMELQATGSPSDCPQWLGLGQGQSQDLEIQSRSLMWVTGPNTCSLPPSLGSVLAGSQSQLANLVSPM